MTGTYKFIEHTADIAAEVSAEKYNDLFTASAFEWKESVIDDFELKNEEGITKKAAKLVPIGVIKG